MRARWTAVGPDIVVSSFMAIGIFPNLPYGDERVDCRVNLKQSLKLQELESATLFPLRFRGKTYHIKSIEIHLLHFLHLPNDF
jgi:hypothetical protein